MELINYWYSHIIYGTDLLLIFSLFPWNWLTLDIHPLRLSLPGLLPTDAKGMAHADMINEAVHDVREMYKTLIYTNFVSYTLHVEFAQIW